MMDVRSGELEYVDAEEVGGMLATETAPAEQVLVQMTDGGLCPMAPATESEIDVRLPPDTIEQLRQGKSVLYRVGERGELWLLQSDCLSQSFEDITMQSAEMEEGVEIGTEILAAVEHSDAEAILKEVVQENPVTEQVTSQSSACSVKLEDSQPEPVNSNTRPESNPIVTSVQQKKLIQAHLTPVSADKPQGRSGQVHQCQTCGASFSSVFHLRRHTHIHTGARPFACKYCPQRFRHKTSLKVHVRKHTGEMPYTCPECRKQFRDPANFKVHVRSHSKEKTYECNHCEKRFNSASTLYAHKKTHDADRPFSCDHCKRAFRFNTTLTRHLRTHTGEKPYSCDHCRAFFTTASNLAAHKKRHENAERKKKEKPLMYSCEHCNLEFHTKNGLKIHRRQHQQQVVRRKAPIREDQPESIAKAQNAEASDLKDRLEPGPTPEKSSSSPNKNSNADRSNNSPESPGAVSERRQEALSLDMVLRGSDSASEKIRTAVISASSSPTDDFQCETCEKKFRNAVVLAAHSRTHNLSRGITVTYMQSVR
ncbi:zinc finger protein 2 [Galendromus occidentalis]|uniref:Zinc finger protein 2 n=1 Tax=Galendromus occidentalis TaxID=34638 RepID=A0AAJ7PAG5_9ACAR|nr:zinc finger protein 2 [Galendromus occidentalis]